ncbi:MULTISPECIES: DUSAM domain-containing protein [Myxococcus]|uniref:DUSAM domain-containing protein n=1 Tax=Myxococcus TaxID=32 RepID=UPI0013D39DC4|nr:MULTISPECIES: DUSAM domain-containing protein [Myxococcus]WIG93891.1 DUSAM domain-containing protein [Myxococcus sp. SDU36]
MPEELDWEPVRALARRVLNGERLALTDDVREMLERTAPEVGFTNADAASALASAETAEAFLLECARRIKDGSWRVMRALHRMYQHKRTGDFDSARQEMRDVLAVEVVPHYREIAEGQLEDLEDEP